MGLDIFFQARPIAFLANELFHFIDSKMASKKVFIMPDDWLGMEDF